MRQLNIGQIAAFIPESRYAPRPFLTAKVTSCARGDTICLRPWQYLRIYSPGGTCSGMLAI